MCVILSVISSFRPFSTHIPACQAEVSKAMTLGSRQGPALSCWLWTRRGSGLPACVCLLSENREMAGQGLGPQH